MFDWLNWLDLLQIIVIILLTIATLLQNISIRKLEHKQKKGEFVHRLQFETEFQAYKEIWNKLIDLRQITYDLRDIHEIGKSDELMDREWKNRRIKKLMMTQGDCLVTFERHKPFYPDEIYKAIKEVTTTSIIEQIDYEHDDMPYEAMEKRNKNIDKLLSNMDDVCEAIRKRIGVIKIKD